MRPAEEKISISQCATLACLWEATVPKPGNVHRGADFENTSFYDFITSASAVGSVMQQAETLRVGELIYQSIAATRRLVRSNTNLGIVLLLAPLAKVPRASSLNSGLPQVLTSLNENDCAQTYAAIQLAQPGGMGQVQAGDVAHAPSMDLLSAMQLAKDRDRIAYQYCHAFADVLDLVTPSLLETYQQTGSLVDAIIHTQLLVLAEIPDSLIARKCGAALAKAATQRAQRLLAQPMGSTAYLHGLADFDFWLRSDGNRRNPGTTADLITAGLFVALRDQQIRPPFNFVASG
jgi:triphosphoribosyl-dephospho-CoA synthase